MQGMVNCYHVCHANFDETTQMVGSARGLTSQDVKQILEQLKREGGNDYKKLRDELPDDFPL
jgi:hypothetical protein